MAGASMVIAMMFSPGQVGIGSVSCSNRDQRSTYVRDGSTGRRLAPITVPSHPQSPSPERPQRVTVVGLVAGVAAALGLAAGVLGNGFWMIGAEGGLAAAVAPAVGLAAGAAGADVAGARVPPAAGG